MCADAIGIFKGCSHVKLQHTPKGTRPLRNVDIINETGYAQPCLPDLITQSASYNVFIVASFTKLIHFDVVRLQWLHYGVITLMNSKLTNT